MLMCGSSRSSHPGSHQLALPISAMVAGTSTIRMTVASTAMAVARPSPIIFTNGDGSLTKLRKTTIMISAPEVMTRPVAASPRATDSALSPVAL